MGVRWASDGRQMGVAHLCVVPIRKAFNKEVRVRLQLGLGLGLLKGLGLGLGLGLLKGSGLGSGLG